MTELSPLLTTESMFSLSVFEKISKFSPVLVDIFISFKLFFISLFFKSDLFIKSIVNLLTIGISDNFSFQLWSLPSTTLIWISDIFKSSIALFIPSISISLFVLCKPAVSYMFTQTPSISTVEQTISLVVPG